MNCDGKEMFTKVNVKSTGLRVLIQASGIRAVIQSFALAVSGRALQRNCFGSTFGDTRSLNNGDDVMFCSPLFRRPEAPWVEVGKEVSKRWKFPRSIWVIKCVLIPDFGLTRRVGVVVSRKLDCEQR
jgi:hypothetical protein